MPMCHEPWSAWNSSQGTNFFDLRNQADYKMVAWWPNRTVCLLLHQFEPRITSHPASRSSNQEDLLRFYFYGNSSLLLFKYGCFVHDNERLLSHNNNITAVRRPLPRIIPALPGRRIISLKATKMWIITFTQNFPFFSRQMEAGR